MNKDKLVFIDVESTGTNVSTDRIWQFAAKCEDKTINLYFNPEVPVPTEVLELCKKPADFNSFLSQQPKFADKADDILPWLQGGVLCGFGILNFDVPILWEELRRANKIWMVQDLRVIDCKEIFHRKEPRDLESAVRFYGAWKSGDFPAHDAMNDVMATEIVLEGMRGLYPDIGDMTPKEIAKFCQPDNYVDLAGKLVYNADGVPCFNFGDKKGTPVLEDLNLANWILRKDFPSQTKMLLRAILDHKDTKQRELL